MSFTRPTLDAIDDRIKADFEANIAAVPIVRQRSPEAGIARALAGASHEMHGHLDWNFTQLFPDLATGAQLERLAGFYGLQRRPAMRATGTAVIAGTDGTAVATSTAFASASGAEVETLTSGVIASGSVTLDIRATATGAAGNLLTGARLVPVAALAGLGEGSVVAPGMAGGADLETDPALQDRVLARMRQPPHGGAGADYVRWALEVPGISQAWVAPGEMGLGTVTLRVAVDDAPYGPIPTGAEIAAVEAHINDRAGASALFEGRPVTARLYVVAPIAAPVPVTLGITPDTSAIRAAIRAELAALFRRSAVPGGIVPRDAISQAVSLAPGLTTRTLIAPAADATPAIGQLPVLGEVTFQ